MIEKKVHIFWFGGSDKTKFIKKLNHKLRGLEKFGYQIIEWSEKNYDVYKNEYTSRCYVEEKWAHLSDYARLDILYMEGGIYLDQDIEVFKNFDNILDNNFFLGYMFDCNLGTAVIGSEKNNPILKNIMKIYEDGLVSTAIPNNDLFTDFFILNMPEFKLNGKSFSHNGVQIFSKEYFEQPSFLYKKNYTIHHFDNSWRNKSKLKIICQHVFKNIIGLYFYRALMCKKALKRSPFYNEWKKNQ